MDATVTSEPKASESMVSDLEIPSLELEEKELTSWQSIKNSLLNVGETIGDVAEFWFDPSGDGSGSRAALDIATNTIASYMFGQEDINKYVEKVGKDSSLAAGLGTESTLESINKLEEERAQTLQTKGIRESAKKGDIGGVIAGTINGITNGIGSVGYFLGTAGTGFFADYVADNYVAFNELKAENLGKDLNTLIEDGEADTGIPIAMASFSQALEYLSFGIITKGVGGAFKGSGGKSLVSSLSKKLAEKLIYNKKARALSNILSTGTTEASTEMLQHVSDKINEKYGSIAGTDIDESNLKLITETFADEIFSPESIEAGLQGFAGGGGIVSGTYSAKAMSTIRTVVDGDQVEKNINDLAVLRRKLKSSNDKTVKKGIQAEIDIQESKIADSVVRGNEIYESLSDGDISEISNLSELMDAAAFNITELNKKLRNGDISEAEYTLARKGFKSELNSAKQGIIDMNLTKNLALAEKEATKRGLKFNSFKTTKELNDAVEKAKNISKENKQAFKDVDGVIHGFSLGNEIFIDEQAAKKAGAINVGAHELLHPIFNKLVGNSKEQGKIVRQFRRSMTSTQRKVIDAEMRKRGYNSRKDYNTEYINVFADTLREGRINYDKTVFEKIGDVVLNMFRPIGYSNISFEDGKGVYNFMKEYEKSAKQGELTEAAAAAIGDANLTVDAKEVKKAKLSLSKTKEVYKELQQIDETESNFTLQPEKQKALADRKKELLNIVKDENIYEELRQIDEFEADFNPTEASKNRKKELLDSINKEEKQDIIKFSKNEKASAEVQRLFNEKPRDWENLVIEQMRPITAKLVERRRDVTGFDREELLRDFEVGERGVFDLIRSYNPSKNDSLAAYINTFLSFRAQESSKRILKPVFESDVTEEKGVAAQEDNLSIEDAVDQSFKPTAEQKSKLRREIKLPDEQVEKVRQAVRKTFGTKLPSPKSSEFKKALRKAFDVELFKDLKTNIFKSRENYRFFMSQNWKALYDAIPQETLNQSFAPFRQEVLDESGKQKREQTPEGERIFKKKNITKEEFLDYFFNPKVGGSTRGTRKDAIVRMLAQELGFDATMETVKEPKVAEKIEFANPDIKLPELSETIDRDQDSQFSNAEIVKKYNLDEDIYTIFDKKSKNKKQDVAKVNKYMDIWIKYLTESGFPPGLINATQINAVITKKYPGKKQSELRNYLKIVVKKRLKDFEKENYIKGFKAPPKVKANAKFGSRVTGKKWDKLSNEKEVEKYVNQSKDNFLSFWSEGINGTYNSLTNQKDKKEFLGLMSLVLESNQKEGSTAHRAGAEVIAKIKKDFEYDGRKNATGIYVEWYKRFFSKDKSKWKRLDWEHAVSSVYAYKELLKSVLNGNFEDVFSKMVPNYTQIPVPPIIQRVLKEAGYEHEVPSNFDISNPKDWVKKYINPKVRAELKKAGLSENWFEENIITLDGSKSFFNKEVQFTVSEKTKKKSEIDLEKVNAKINKEFNKILEDSTSIAASETVSDVKARLAGEKKTKFRFFIPPSADDLMGLLYYTLGKGKIGDGQLKWYNKNIISPFAQAMEAVSRDRNETAKRFNELVKDLGIIPKKLRKEIPGEPFTQEQAVRVYVWDKQGMSVPGLSKAEKTKLVKYINDNKQLKQFGDKLLTVNKGFDYAKPTESWTAGTITSDLKETSNTTKRAAFLTQWQKNVDVIFSKENLNKLEAAYGREYRLAMENMLQRMKTGRNRDFAGDKLTTRFVDWINGSVGAIMFFNTRSAILQTLSAVNFINFSDNNIFAAAKAFSNQKQYWNDFSMLFNSDFLVDRRQGLRMDINEADLATAAKQGGAKGVISKLLKLGFTPTQLADSFAIAAGGSTFYRNRLQSLIKEGMDQKAAEKIAFQEFRETAEESQQSSRPDKISQQQAGPLGRVILAFANTPSQYARITKKAFLDLKNGRGDAKTNISKIVYYTFAQNLIFNALQQALFAISFADNDEEEEKLKDKKIARIANGMADSVLRGLGFGGAIASTVKNIALKINEKSKKKNPEYQDIALDILKISPPISSKITKLRSAARAYDWNKKEMMEEGISIDNPAALALGEITSAITNIPLDRAIRKVQNVDASINDDLDFYQRLALIGGWNKWDLGIQNKKKKKKEFKPIKSTDSGRLIIKIK